MQIDGVFRIRLSNRTISYDDEYLNLASNFKIYETHEKNKQHNNSQFFSNFNIKRKCK